MQNTFCKIFANNKGRCRRTAFDFVSLKTDGAAR
jgi:hypothetical protein